MLSPAAYGRCPCMQTNSGHHHAYTTRDLISSGRRKFALPNILDVVPNHVQFLPLISRMTTVALIAHGRV
eukprot:2209738-Pleurochrysis_carterae.AAC.3